MQFPPPRPVMPKAPQPALVAPAPPSPAGQVHGRFYKIACWTDDVRTAERGPEPRILDISV